MDDTVTNRPVVNQQEAYSYIDIPIRSVLCEAISLELQDVDDDALKRIIAYMTLVNESGTYMFFTAESILAITEAVSNHLSLRRFIFGLHERTNILASSAGLNSDWLSNYNEVILKSRSIYGESSINTLISSDIRGTLYAPNLSELLKHNAWVTTIYLAVFMGAWNAALVDYVKASS